MARPRGLVFFILIGLVALVGVFGVWRMLGSRSGGDGAVVDRGPAGGARKVVKGTGTSWGEEPTQGDASGVMEGLVLDGDGKPVDGARITLGRIPSRGEDSAPGSFFQPRGLTTSAGGGRFRLDALVPGDYNVTAMHEAWAPAQRTRLAVKANETTKVELKLGRGGLVLRGRVLDVGGGAVGGAKVTVVTRSAGATALLQVAAGADGQYRITLARGGHMLRAEAEGYAPSQDDVFMARATTKDLRLVPAARLSGRVIERASKQPLADASVSLTSASRFDFRMPRDGKTDAAGHFEFSGLEPGNYEVMARKGLLIGAGKVVALAVAQSVQDVEVEVDRGFLVSGRVKDDRGSGLANIRVFAQRNSPPFGQAARTRTNPDGSYALEGMLPGEYRINASEEGYGWSNVRARVLAADVTDADLTLPVAAKVTGRVVTAEGKPVEGAAVQASFEVTMSGGGMMSSGDFARSDADGSFELKRVPPGRLRVNARHEELGSASLGPEQVKPGEPKQLTLTLQKGATITGTVKTDEGRPAPDVRVTAMVRNPGMFSDAANDVSGPDGRYRLTGLPGGRLSVAAYRGTRPMWGMNDTPDQKSLQLGGTEEKVIDLVVGAAGLSIAGLVVGADGKPVPGAIVTAGPERDGRAFRGNARDLRAYSNLDGQFTIDNVNKAPHSLWAQHPEHPEAELKGVAGGSKGVKVQFPPETTVAGVVVLPDGKPVQHYTIVILPGPKPDEKPEDKRRRQMNTFDAPNQRVQNPSGAFELRKLAAGSHELAISTPAGETANQLITVQAGERKTGVRIQLQPGVRITGRVVEYGSEKPIPGSNVMVMGAGGARTEGEVGPDGNFTISGAPSGDTINLNVNADPTRHVGENKQIDVKPGQSTVDAGTFKLLPGNQRERMMVDMSERGQVGAFFRQEQGRAVVRSVEASGPAARAGVAKGDLLVSIDGQNARDLGNGALNYLIQGKPGTGVTIVVESAGGGNVRTVKLTREAFKPPPPRSN